MKLSDLIIFSSAFEIAAFSQVYSKAISDKKFEQPKSPDGLKDISHSVDLSIKVGEMSLKMAKEDVPVHRIHLTRYLIQNFKLIVRKIEEDIELFRRAIAAGKCEGCDRDLTIFENDKKTCIAYVEYLIRNGGFDDESFANFFKKYSTVFLD